MFYLLLVLLCCRGHEKLGKALFKAGNARGKAVRTQRFPAPNTCFNVHASFAVECITSFTHAHGRAVADLARHLLATWFHALTTASPRNAN